jgi:hypothetical protein
MFDSRDFPILKFTLQMIEEAEVVIRRYGDAASALSDIEGKNAILFNHLQIGEKLNKIKSIEI